MSAAGPVRVLYCEQNVDGTIGGSYYSLLYLVKGLDRTRFEPTVVFYTDHSLLPAFRDAGVKTLVWRRPGAFAFAGHLPPGLRWLHAPVLALQKGLNLGRGLLLPALVRARFLRVRGIALVHLNNSILWNHDWMLACLLTGRKCLTHERGINDRYPSSARYFGRRLKAVICISEAVRQAMRACGADFGNLVTISNGLDPAMMRRRVPAADLRQRHGLEPGAPVIVMIGNIKAWKGQDTLIRAIGLVRQSIPNVRCLLVGATSSSDLPYEQQLRELVTSLGLERHVVFAGFHETVADYMDLSDVVVHASILPEPFGRVLLEAMACRRPVVASNAGGVPEIVVDGGTGLLFPPGDSEGLASALSTLLRDRDRARRMGESGYARLVDRFHLSHNIKATERLYESILHEGH